MHSIFIKINKRTVLVVMYTLRMCIDSPQRIMFQLSVVFYHADNAILLTAFQMLYISNLIVQFSQIDLLSQGTFIFLITSWKIIIQKEWARGTFSYGMWKGQWILSTRNKCTARQNNQNQSLRAPEIYQMGTTN